MLPQNSSANLRVVQKRIAPRTPQPVSRYKCFSTSQSPTHPHYLNFANHGLNAANKAPRCPLPLRSFYLFQVFVKIPADGIVRIAVIDALKKVILPG